MLNTPNRRTKIECTVRDLVKGEYRKHQLRSGILKHNELDTPIKTAIVNRKKFLMEFSKLSDVGPKAVKVVSDLLDRAAAHLEYNERPLIHPNSQQLRDEKPQVESFE